MLHLLAACENSFESLTEIFSQNIFFTVIVLIQEFDNKQLKSKVCKNMQYIAMALNYGKWNTLDYKNYFLYYLESVREEIYYLRTDPLYKITHFRLSIVSVIISCRESLCQFLHAHKHRDKNILKLH